MHAFSSAISLAVILFVGSLPCAANLITNAGFETGNLTGWTAINTNYGGVSVRSDSYYTDPLDGGSYFAFASNLYSAAQIELQQSTAVESAVPGTVYYSFDLRLILSRVGGSFLVHIWDLDSSGGIIDQGPGPLQPNIATDGSWHRFSGTFTAPLDVDHFEIEFDTAIPTPPGGAVEIMLIDNVFLSQIPEPCSLLLTMLGVLMLWCVKQSGHRNGHQKS